MTTSIPGQFDAFESAVMTKALAGDHPVLANLRAQFAGALASSRTFTGVGFWVDIEPAPDAVPLPNAKNLEVLDVYADIAGMKRGVAFIVFVRDGLLTQLEAHTYAEPWPAAITDFTLKYVMVEGRRHVMEGLEGGDPYRSVIEPIPDE